MRCGAPSRVWHKLRSQDPVPGTGRRTGLPYVHRKDFAGGEPLRRSRSRLLFPPFLRAVGCELAQQQVGWWQEKGAPLEADRESRRLDGR